MTVYSLYETSLSVGDSYIIFVCISSELFAAVSADTSSAVSSETALSAGSVLSAKTACAC
ncbi:MAG: hypothetical protein LUD77_03915 [Clostridiales bacterium]|nr:hypothetical protein [Clostridiales bacterium]